jgi:hypothetical protein
MYTLLPNGSITLAEGAEGWVGDEASNYRWIWDPTTLGPERRFAIFDGVVASKAVLVMSHSTETRVSCESLLASVADQYVYGRNPGLASWHTFGREKYPDD